MTLNFPSLQPGQRLSDQVAQALELQIRQGNLPAGEKLPTEMVMTQQFQVSRTVVREAISRLKSRGLVYARQGSGVFVSEHSVCPLDFESQFVHSLQAVVQMVEVRRALEAEVAALAALRRNPEDLGRIRACMDALESQALSAEEGVEVDMHLHRAIAQAAHNPFLLNTLQYLEQFLRDAMRITRANEALRSDFVHAVKKEHHSIVTAIEEGNAAQARRAASRHMDNAIERIQRAPLAFWYDKGAVLAQRLVTGTQAGSGEH